MQKSKEIRNRSYDEKGKKMLVIFLARLPMKGTNDELDEQLNGSIVYINLIL